ncbi:selenocysteine-specific translation elongation factor [bacterium]|nr:selenocysteine-specific translation elongation factor [bacterium]
MKHAIIGTAGHVDHGKTALVKALTGTDCDRLKEEKERGLTIELGYAHLDLGDGKGASIVDVPGHERFVKTMLAGTGVIDCVLFVIAADEGVMPQTIEHFDIINLLGIKHGLIVLTKVDLVGPEWLGLVREDIAELVRGTPFGMAPIVYASSVTREGIDSLKERIEKLLEGVEPRNEQRIFRFPIDWTFGVSGIGSVICGIIFSGKAKVRDRLEIVPQQKEVRVRGIQVHGEDAEEMFAGQLVAVNLSGIELSEIRRGDVLSSPGYLRPTYMLDARLRLLDNSPIVLKDRTRIRLHLACSEVLGRIVLLDKEKLAPGDDAFVQFRLEEQLTAEHGDQFVIRQYSPTRTIGGGMILDSYPPKHKRFRAEIISHLKVMEKGSPKERIEQILLKLRTQASTEEDLIRVSNIPPIEMKNVLETLTSEQKVFVFGRERNFIHIDWYNKTKAAITDNLRQFHTEQPLKLGMSREELRTKLPYKIELDAYSQILRDLIAEGTVSADGTGERVRLASHTIKLSEVHEAIKQQIEEIFLNTGFATPLPEDAIGKWSGKEVQIAQEVFDVLVETEGLIQVDEKVFLHPKTVDKAKELIVKHIRFHGKLTLKDCRNLLQTSRKYMLPILYYFDEMGVTLRVGDDRILRGGI